MERERPPTFQISCNNHGSVGIGHSLDEAIQRSSDHMFMHPECEDFIDDAGIVRRHVHIADTSGNVWR